jgi:hypothetical protein
MTGCPCRYGARPILKISEGARMGRAFPQRGDAPWTSIAKFMLGWTLGRENAIPRDRRAVRRTMTASGHLATPLMPRLNDCCSWGQATVADALSSDGPAPRGVTRFGRRAKSRPAAARGHAKRQEKPIASMSFHVFCVYRPPEPRRGWAAPEVGQIQFHVGCLGSPSERQRS